MDDLKGIVCDDGVGINEGIIIITMSSASEGQLSVTSGEWAPESLFECAICLLPFVSPVTLTCGHTYAVRKIDTARDA